MNINNFINFNKRDINNILYFLKFNIIILIDKCKKYRVYNIQYNNAVSMILQ